MWRVLLAVLLLALTVAAPHSASAWMRHGTYLPGCPYGSTYADGCLAGGSQQQGAFFTGYANQSFGAGLPATVNLQPASYAVRPPWNVPGVDYAVGIPTARLPVSSLKDPANIGSDAAANPDGAGLDCSYHNGDATSTTWAPAGGAVVLCSKSGSTAALVIDGYNFGLHGCTALVMGSGTWTSFTLSNNLFVNGPNCNSYKGTAPWGANLAYQLDLPSGSLAVPVTFTHNTVFGCGDDLQGALEAAQCAINFPLNGGAFTYTANITGTSMVVTGAPVGAMVQAGQPISCGACTGVMAVVSGPAGGGNGTYVITNPNGISASGATITSLTNIKAGVAPFDNHFWQDFFPGNRTITYNAFMHIPGRVIQGNYVGGVDTVKFNYIEGMIYPNQGEHGEFKEYGDRINGTMTVDYEFNVCLQTGNVNAGANLGSQACFYLSTGDRENRGNITGITVSGGVGSMTYSSVSGDSIQAGDTLVLSGTGNATLNGTTWTVTAGGNPLTFTCGGCLNTDTASTGTYIASHQVTFTGKVHNNVFVTNLVSARLPYWSTQTAAASFSYNSFDNLTVNENYVDPTGSIYGWGQSSQPTIGNVTFSGNKSLLGSAGDASANRFNTSLGDAYGSQTH